MERGAFHLEKKINQRRFGAFYEDLAAAHLKSEGCRILERNFRAGRSGEIDILAEDPSGLLIAAEVKYRRDGGSGGALAAVGPVKQKKICRTLLYYYYKRGWDTGHPCRFDVIGIEADGRIQHVENAFDFSV